MSSVYSAQQRVNSDDRYSGSIKDSKETTWPQDVSHVPNLMIGRVVEQIQAEFPTLTVSKVRFFENQGLVEPKRTSSRYRMFSQADVERIRYILREQRDSYKQIRVIRSEIADLDAGRTVANENRPRTITRDGQIVRPSPGTWINKENIEILTGATPEFIDEAVNIGIIRQESSGSFPARMVSVVQSILDLNRLGFSIRNFRQVSRAAHSSVDMVRQARAPYSVKTSSIEIERELNLLSEVAIKLSIIYSETIRDGLENQKSRGLV